MTTTLIKNGTLITSTTTEQAFKPDGGDPSGFTTLYIVLVSGSVQLTTSGDDVAVIDSGIATRSTADEKILMSVGSNESLRALGTATLIVTW